MNELVTMIIPAYQEEKKIGRCLKSIAASTYRNLELIVVNDGSTDSTQKVVEQFKEKYKPGDIELELINVTNGGSGRARNCGMQKARGKYIGFVDGDDMIHPQMIERLVLSLRKGNDMASCGLLFCKESGKAGRYHCRLRRQAVSCPEKALSCAMWGQIQMSLGPALFRREKIIDKNGKLLVSCPEDTVAFEDFAFICRYLNQCNGIWARLPFYGYQYCKHEKSLTSKRWSQQELSHALEPVLAIGEGMGDPGFISHKLQYAFRFLALWYEEAFRQGKWDSFKKWPGREICEKELEKYADIYMDSPDMPWCRKLVMRIVREYPKAGWYLAKAMGQFGMFEEND